MTLHHNHACSPFKRATISFFYLYILSLNTFFVLYLHTFITLPVTSESRVLCRYSDNDTMTGYTCCDYHRDDSLILCSVYDLHRGLVMFCTDSVVIRRIARSHLSVFINSSVFAPSSRFLSNFVIVSCPSHFLSSSLLYRYISVLLGKICLILSVFLRAPPRPHLISFPSKFVAAKSLCVRVLESQSQQLRVVYVFTVRCLCIFHPSTPFL